MGGKIAILQSPRGLTWSAAVVHVLQHAAPEIDKKRSERIWVPTIVKFMALLTARFDGDGFFVKTRAFHMMTRLGL